MLRDSPDESTPIGCCSLGKYEHLVEVEVELEVEVEVEVEVEPTCSTVTSLLEDRPRRFTVGLSKPSQSLPEQW